MKKFKNNIILLVFTFFVSTASIMGLATPIGAFLSGPLMDNFGRKRTNVIMVIPCVAAWFLTFTTTNDQIMILYVARFLSGIAVGKRHDSVFHLMYLVFYKNIF